MEVHSLSRVVDRGGRRDKDSTNSRKMGQLSGPLASRKMGQLSGPLAIIASLFLMACNESFEGDFSTASKGSLLSIFIDGSEEPLFLESGRMRVQLQFSPFQEKSKLVLHQLKTNSRASISIPNSVLEKSNRNFYVRAEVIQQNFDLSGSIHKINYSEREKSGVKACNYTGFCMTCMPDVYHNEPGCGFKFSNYCSGSRNVLYLEKTHYETYHMKFVNPSNQDSRPLALFHSDPIEKVQKELISQGKCQ